jgi:predicted O-methyltransferase YrrM
MTKPFSQACENNRGPISQVLERVLVDCQSVFEIGSGTGQHAVWFSRAMPHLQWQTSDRKENHQGITQWISDSSLENIHHPLELDVGAGPWPEGLFDAIFTANTAHIMALSEVELMFSGVSKLLISGGLFCLYGPMQYSGVIAAESNRAFDARLRAVKSTQGIREFNDLNKLAATFGMELIEDNDLPANNQLIIWQKH